MGASSQVAKKNLEKEVERRSQRSLLWLPLQPLRSPESERVLRRPSCSLPGGAEKVLLGTQPRSPLPWEDSALISSSLASAGYFWKGCCIM